MTGEARALANILLDHHRRICQPRALTRNYDVHECTITYGNLCEAASVPWLTHAVGPFLDEIAKWCHANGYPPLNSLAVNAGTRVPGEGYDGAGGGICSDLRWPQEVASCIAFTGYPRAV